MDPCPATDGSAIVPPIPPPSLPPDSRLACLSFAYEFRKYQRLILAHVGDDLVSRTADRRFHIVSPPGSGKTILGIEMIRRVGAPAVVFSPTVTIQQQWRERVALFAPEGTDLDTLVTTDPKRAAPINVFTYQLIAAPAEADEILHQTAKEKWVASLLVDGQALDEDAARARLASLERNNADAYRRELARRAVRLKRSLIRKPNPDIGRFLHPNARRLIDRLVDSGIRTIVLDECHHLLDYWAVVLSYMIARIDNPTVIGLTATLPTPEDGYEYENYTGLLGEVDYEVPVPAVVKEGNLAPYRDLVYFVQPSGNERAYLRNAQAAFERATANVTEGDRWASWLTEARFETEETVEDRWAQALGHDAPVAVAALRHMQQAGLPFRDGLDVPPEAFDEPMLEDRLLLLERFGLGELKTSADPEDHTRLADLKKALRPFGITLTESGMRQTRSPGDLILSYSSSKAQAAARILTLESKALGPRLRAVLVTDFERTGASGKRLGMAYPSGSARQVFLDLVSHPTAGALDPLLVTGSTLWMDADHGEPLIDHFNEYLKAKKLRAKCSLGPSPHPGVFEISGEGPDWGSGTYVAMVTAAFEAGAVKCLVGTRGLFSEGWDTLTLNTLVDLTTAATATTTQQLRGRSIRVDPQWHRKVAHNWDIICVAPDYARGDEDLKRLTRRHKRVWGVVPPAMQVEKEHVGRIVKGLPHVDPEFASKLLWDGFERAPYLEATARSLGQIGDRRASYDLWDVGSEYENFSYSASRIASPDMRIRTVHTITDTLRAMLAKFRTSLVLALFEGLFAAPQVFARIRWWPRNWPSITLVALVILGFTFAINARQAWRIGRKVLREQPVDTILLDIARAVLGALKERGFVSPNLQPEFVRVVEQLDLSYEVMLDYASTADADTFTRAFGEVLAPVRTQRYLVSRSEARLPQLWLEPLWLFLRFAFPPKGGYPPCYHPVPSLLAAKKSSAECFARHWNKHVGSGTLVFTHGPEGWRILMAARAQRRPRSRDMAFEVWR